ncbi:MAG: LapA family protein [Syntrophales bacterium]|jgi:uncharacterized integral membrane protein|nr:LapA family protein [Syntrophales bacterium]
MNVIYTVIGAIIVLFLVTFSLDNTVSIRLSYYGYFERWLPTYLLIFLSFLIGVIFTGILGIVERFRMTRTINRLNKTIRDLHREIKVKDSASYPPYAETPEKPELTDNVKTP